MNIFPRPVVLLATIHDTKDTGVMSLLDIETALASIRTIIANGSRSPTISAIPPRVIDASPFVLRNFTSRSRNASASPRRNCSWNAWLRKFRRQP